MFIDEPSRRRKVTQNLRNEIAELRVRNGYSANYFAKNIIKKPQSWLAQIESGRTKTISDQDLIMMYSCLLSMNEDEVENYLTNNYDRLFVDDQSNTNSDTYKGKKISYFKADDLSGEKILMDKYQQLIEHLDNGLLFFFDKIENKEDAISMLQIFTENMHSDLGFTLSIASLPLFIMSNANTETKKKVFDEMFELIKSNSNPTETTMEAESTTNKQEFK